MRSRRIAVIAVLLALGAGVAAMLWHRSASNPSKSKVAAATAETDDATAQRKRHRASRDSAASDPDPVGPLQLEGQVIDADARGVGGATVAITTNPTRTVTTEDDGSFAIDGLLPRSYSVIAHKDRAVSMAATIRLRPTTEPVILRLRAALTVAIHVVDDVTDAPIAGAFVTTEWLLEQDVETDADGVALLLGHERWLWVEIEAVGYAPASLNVTLPDDPGGRLDRTVRLIHGAPLSGVVLGPDGAPVAGADLWAEGTNAMWASARTEVDGTFRFDALAPGTYTLHAYAEHFPVTDSAPIDVDGKTPRTGIELRLAAGVRLRGVVVDEAGAPVPLAEVRASVEFYGHDTTAGADGTFELLGLERSAEVSVMASVDDRASPVTMLDTTAGDVEGVELIVADGAISGVVVDEHGEPVAEANVRAMPNARDTGVYTADDEDLTDSAGRFTLGPMPPGEYMVSATWPGSDPREAMDWDHGVTVTAGARDVKITLPAAGELTGVVILDGAPVTEYAVAAGRWGGAGTPTMVHAADGRFTLRGITPGPIGLVLVGESFGRYQQDDLVVAAGARTDLGRIEVHRGRTLHGRVVDAAGQGVGGATVVVAPYLLPSSDGIVSFDDDPVGGAMRNEHTRTTGADGTFTIAGLDTVPLQAMADHPRVGRSRGVALDPDQTELDLTLLATGAVRGTVAHGEGSSIEISLVDGGPTVYGSPLRDGTYRVGGLIPGRYYVAATNDRRGTPTVIVDVKADETVGADLAFVTGSLTLTVHLGARTCNAISLQVTGSTIDHDQVLEADCDGPDVALRALAAGAYQVCIETTCTPVTLTTNQTLDLSTP